MDSERLKIVYCTPAIYSAGGVERVVTMKASYFAEEYGYDVTIIVTEGKGRDSFFPLSNKVKVVNFEINFEELWTCSFIKRIFVYLKKQCLFKKRLTQELLQIRPHITISTLRREINFINNIKDGSKKIGELHVNRANYRSFKTEKSNLVKNLFAKYWSYNLVKHLKRLDRLVVLTEKDREAWTELDHVDVIPDPLPFIPASVSPLTEKRVITVTRYSYEKGVDLLLQAWAEVEKEIPDWRLDVYGNGDTAPYEKIINELQIDCNRCRLNGRTNEVEREYCNSSLFVLSSRFEGFGMVIVEAMACGVPVVAFDCPWGPQAIINDGEDGLLVENGNVNKLAEAICYLIKNKEIREQIGKKCVNSVQQYHADQIMPKWLNLLNKNVM